MEPYKWWVNAYPSVRKLSRFLLKDKSDTLSSKYVRAGFRQHGGKYRKVFLKYYYPSLFCTKKATPPPEWPLLYILLWYYRAHNTAPTDPSLRSRWQKCLRPLRRHGHKHLCKHLICNKLYKCRIPTPLKNEGSGTCYFFKLLSFKQLTLVQKPGASGGLTLPGGKGAILERIAGRTHPSRTLAVAGA